MRQVAFPFVFEFDSPNGNLVDFTTVKIPYLPDQSSTNICATFTTGLIFARWSKQMVAILCFDLICTFWSISWSILNGFSCNLHNKARFCETIKTRGSSSMFWLKIPSFSQNIRLLCPIFQMSTGESLLHCIHLYLCSGHSSWQFGNL